MWQVTDWCFYSPEVKILSLMVWITVNTTKAAVEASGRNSTCRCDWKHDLDINEGFQVPTVGRSQCRCNRPGTGTIACGTHSMVIYADDCCPHWQRGLYYHPAKIRMLYFLVLTTVRHSSNCSTAPFSQQLWDETARKRFPFLLITSYPDTWSTHIHLEEQRLRGL